MVWGHIRTKIGSVKTFEFIIWCHPLGLQRGAIVKSSMRHRRTDKRSQNCCYILLQSMKPSLCCTPVLKNLFPSEHLNIFICYNLKKKTIQKYSLLLQMQRLCFGMPQKHKRRWQSLNHTFSRAKSETTGFDRLWSRWCPPVSKNKPLLPNDFTARWQPCLRCSDPLLGEENGVSTLVNGHRVFRRHQYFCFPPVSIF